MARRQRGQVIAKGGKRGPWGLRRQGSDAKGFYETVYDCTRADACRRLAKLIVKRDDGELVTASKRKLGAYLRDWLATRRRTTGIDKARTVRDYTENCERYLIPFLGDVPLAKLTFQHIDAMYERMGAIVSARTSKPLAPRTIRIAHAVLHTALAKAVRDGLIARNPADRATLPAKVDREMRALSVDEARRLLAAVRNDAWSAWWTMLLVLGLRPEEAGALYWTDIVGDQLSIRRAITPRHRGVPAYTHALKTVRSKRTLFRTASAQSALQAHKRRQAEERLAAGGAYGASLTDEQRAGGGFVFANAICEMVNYETLAKAPWRRVLKAADLPAMRVYDLRHTSISLALESGEQIKVVSERAGHSSAMLTLNTYAHVLPGAQEGAAARMERLLSVNA